MTFGGVNFSGEEPMLPHKIHRNALIPLVPAKDTNGILNGRVVTLLTEREKNIGEFTSCKASFGYYGLLWLFTPVATIGGIMIIAQSIFDHPDIRIILAGVGTAIVMPSLLLCRHYEVYSSGQKAIKNSTIFNSRNELCGLLPNSPASTALLINVLTKLESSVFNEIVCKKKIIEEMSYLQLWSVWERLSWCRQNKFINPHLNKNELDALKFFHKPDQGADNFITSLRQYEKTFKTEPLLLYFVTMRLSKDTLQDPNVSSELESFKGEDVNFAVPYPLVSGVSSDDMDKTEEGKGNRNKQLRSLNKFILTGKFPKTISNLIEMLELLDNKENEAARELCCDRIFDTLDVNHDGLWSDPKVAKLLDKVVSFDTLTDKALERANNLFGRILKRAELEHNWPLLQTLLLAAKEEKHFQDLFNNFNFKEGVFSDDFHHLKAFELAFTTEAPKLLNAANSCLTEDNSAEIWEYANRKNIAKLKEACVKFTPEKLGTSLYVKPAKEEIV